MVAEAQRTVRVGEGGGGKQDPGTVVGEVGERLKRKEESIQTRESGLSERQQTIAGKEALALLTVSITDFNGTP